MIVFKFVYLTKIKIYIRSQKYKEDFTDMTALVPNFDNSLIFETEDGSWMDAKATCEKHNALLYFPKGEKQFYFVHKKFNAEPLHIGLYLKDGEWTTSKGTNVWPNQTFWDSTPTGNKNCVGVSSASKMVDYSCTTEIRKGLCIY